MMRILVVTNLYPPQELGGYGRAMADFVWGLQQRGHQLQVLTSDAPYLGPGGVGPSHEPVDRRLRLKGSFEGGVQNLEDASARRLVDQANIQLLRYWLKNSQWDGVLLGNLDLIGAEIFSVLLEAGIPVLHHVGFVSPPYHPQQLPLSSNYRLVAASCAVRESLFAAGFSCIDVPVVYPGARVELFGPAATGRSLPSPPDGSVARPLRVCFAGLMMSTKGPHTLLEALALLQQGGVAVEAMLAGGEFEAAYFARMKKYVDDVGLNLNVRFLPVLNRPQLARFFVLQHVCVFTSLYPEAFGIVAAEAMASGLALVSSGVGGAAELFESGESGLLFRPGDAADLAQKLQMLVSQPGLLKSVQDLGRERVLKRFSVQGAAAQLETLFAETLSP